MNKQQQDEMMQQFHATIVDCINHWRERADDPDISEGELREDLRNSTSILERLGRSVFEQHEALKDLQKHARFFIILFGIIAVYHITTVFFLVKGE